MRTSFDATGEVLVVTGGANGIGRAVALEFADAGGTSIVLDIAAPDDEALQHSGVVSLQVDVTDQDAVSRTIDTAIKDYGKIDALIAGAAIQPRQVVVEQSPATWQKVIDTNLNGVVWISRAVAPHMVKRGCGSMVFFTSGLALTGHPEAAAYAASKAALIGYAKSLAAELFSDRIKVNLISPGVIDTPQFRAANPGTDWDHWKQTTGIGLPEDVVGPLMFLLSDAATMSGSILSRDKALSKRVQN